MNCVKLFFPKKVKIQTFALFELDGRRIQREAVIMIHDAEHPRLGGTHGYPGCNYC